MKTPTTVLLILVAHICLGQIRSDAFCFSADYASAPTLLDGQHGRQLVFGTEICVNDLLSVEALVTSDRDTWRAFGLDAGAGVYGLNPMYKWSNRMHELYVGGRLYPVENFHSQALNIRDKKCYGIYVTMGYGMLRYERHNFHREIYQRSLVNDSTGVVTNLIDSSFIHHHGYTLLMRGMQFGFGWKQYHSGWIYTDIGVVTSAYRQRYTTIDAWNQEDTRRNQSADFFPPALWADYVEGVRGMADNGRGFVLRLSIGINLDMKR